MMADEVRRVGLGQLGLCVESSMFLSYKVPEAFSKEGPALLFRKVAQAARVTEGKLGFTRSWQTFSVKDQIVHILGFACHLISA